MEACETALWGLGLQPEVEKAHTGFGHPWKSRVLATEDGREDGGPRAFPARRGSKFHRARATLRWPSIHIRRAGSAASVPRPRIKGEIGEVHKEIRDDDRHR